MHGGAFLATGQLKMGDLRICACHVGNLPPPPPPLTCALFVCPLQKEFLAATTEKDIFDHLGLEYMEPWQRNA